MLRKELQDRLGALGKRREWAAVLMRDLQALEQVEVIRGETLPVAE